MPFTPNLFEEEVKPKDTKQAFTPDLFEGETFTPDLFEEKPAPIGAKMPFVPEPEEPTTIGRRIPYEEKIFEPAPKLTIDQANILRGQVERVEKKLGYLPEEEKKAIFSDVFTELPKTRKPPIALEAPVAPGQIESLALLTEEDIKHPIKALFQAGTRYPRALLSGLEAVTAGTSPIEAVKKGWLPEITDEKIRSTTEIAWDIADRVYGYDESTSTGWNFLKYFPYTTLGTLAEIKLNPAIFLTFQGINKVLTNPYVSKVMGADIPAPKWFDDAIKTTIRGFHRPFENLAQNVRENRINAITDELYKKFESRLGEIKQVYRQTYKTEPTINDIKGLIKKELVMRGIYEKPLIELQRILLRGKKVAPLRPEEVKPGVKPEPTVEPTKAPTPEVRPPAITAKPTPSVTPTIPAEAPKVPEGIPEAKPPVTPPEAKEPWQMTKDEWHDRVMVAMRYTEQPPEIIKRILEGHRNHVKEAIAKGEPVPSEVLADYPELAKPAPEIVAIKEWTDIPELDAQIRTIKLPKKEGDEWEIDIGLQESLGEQGGDILTQFYKKEPTFKEIKKDIIDSYKEKKIEINKEIAMGITAKSARDEMIESVIDKVLSKVAKPETIPSWENLTSEQQKFLRMTSEVYKENLATEDGREIIRQYLQEYNKVQKNVVYARGKLIEIFSDEKVHTSSEIEEKFGLTTATAWAPMRGAMHETFRRLIDEGQIKAVPGGYVKAKPPITAPPAKEVPKIGKIITAKKEPIKRIGAPEIKLPKEWETMTFEKQREWIRGAKLAVTAPPVKEVPAPKGKITVLPRKEQLLTQIQEAIKKAPDKELPVVPERPDPRWATEETKAFYNQKLAEYQKEIEPLGKVSFEIDGGANIINTKKTLTEFYNKVKKEPDILRAPTERKKGVPKPVATRQEDIGMLRKVEIKGYFTDGALLIKGEPPAKAKFVTEEPPLISKEMIENLLNAPTTPAQKLYYYIQTSETEGVSPTPISKEAGKVGKEIENIPHVLFESEGKYWRYNQFKFNAINNRFPDADYGITKNGMLIAYIKGEPVGGLMARTMEDISVLPLQKEAEEAGLIEPITKPTAEIEEGEALEAKRWEVKMALEAEIPEKIDKTTIMNWLEKAFKVPIKGKATHKWKHAGVYYPKAQIVRMEKWGELSIATHEIAHHIDLTTLKKQYPEGWRKGALGFQKELADLDYDQTKRRTKEGFAEYMRYRLTTELASEKAPKFHKFFNEFLKRNPDLEKILNKTKEMMDIWNKQGAENRIIQHIDWKGEHTKIKGIMPKLKNALKFINEKFNDEFYVPQKMVAEIEKVIGKKISPSKNPAIMMEYSKSKAGAIARTFIMDKAIDEYGNVVGSGLVEVLKPIPNKEMKQFIIYAVSQRALNLSKRNIESGFDIDDVKFVIEKYKDKGWDETAKKLTDWANHSLNWVVRAGGLDAKAAQLMRDLNPIYVIFKRAFIDEVGVISGVGGYVDTGGVIKGIKGSGRPIINPIEGMIAQLRELISKSQKIKIANLWADLAEKEGLGGFIVRVPAPIKATTFNAEQIKGYIKEITGEDISNLDDFLTVFTQDFRYMGKENIVSLWRGGELKFYEIHTDLYEALKGVDPLKLGPILKLFAPFSRMLRLGATGLKFSFGLARNPFRDAFSYVVFSKRNKVTIFDPIKGIYKDLATKPGEATWRFKKLGGALSGQIGLDRAATQSTYDEMLMEKLGKTGKVLKIVKHPLNTLRDILSVTEMGPRSIEIENSYKKYTSEKWQKEHPDWTEEDAFVQAFIDAQDVTVNFTKSGKWAKQINQTTAFFNVAIRGPEKVYRSFRERPIQTFVKSILWLTLLAVGSWYKNKDKDWYKNLPPAYKYNNLFFEIEGNVYRLPIPFEIGMIFMSAPQATLDTFRDKDVKWLKGVADLAKSQIPDPTPSVFQPAIDVATNRNYLGIPIESEGMQYLYPTERKRDYTSKFAMGTSKGLDEIGIHLSPVQLDYLMDGYSGGFLRQFRISGDELYDLPVLGDLMLRDPNYPRRQLNEFFSDFEVLKQKKLSDIATKDEKEKANKMDSFYKYYKVIQKRIKNIKEKKDDELLKIHYKLLGKKLEEHGYK